MKYQKKQKVFIVMTQNRRPISQCFLWQELYSPRFGTVSFFFFSSSCSKKKLFLPNLLNTTEKTKFQESKTIFVHSFIHSLLYHTDLLSFEGFSFYKLSKTKNSWCLRVQHTAAPLITKFQIIKRSLQLFCE